MGESGHGKEASGRLDLLASRKGLEISFPTVPAEDPVPRQAALPGEGAFALPRGRLVVVVNDAQRPTPTPWLLRRLALDWEAGDITVAVATGSHAPPGAGELDRIFGTLLEKVRPRLVIHRPEEERAVCAGSTPAGTPVRINPLLDGADAVVCLGSVEPHYFAAWTGGRKSLVPGLCSLETMRHNHRLALGGGRPGDPESSPVHQDLDDALGVVESWLRREKACEVLGLNVVCREEKIHDWFFGPLGQAVEALSPAGRAVFGRIVEEPFPLVVCLVDPPLDRDLYQALKAFENWKGAVAPGGVLVLAAECAGGLGPPAFQQFVGSPPGLSSLLERVGRDYRLGDHKLVSLLRFLESGRSLLVASGGPLPGGSLAVPLFPSLAGALDAAEGVLEERPLRTLCVRDSAHLYPLAPPATRGVPPRLDRR